MTISDDEQIRCWAVDYALRLHPKEEEVTPERIIAEAKKFNQYITAKPPAKTLRLARDNTKK